MSSDYNVPKLLRTSTHEDGHKLRVSVHQCIWARNGRDLSKGKPTPVSMHRDAAVCGTWRISAMSAFRASGVRLEWPGLWNRRQSTCFALQRNQLEETEKNTGWYLLNSTGEPQINNAPRHQHRPYPRMRSDIHRRK